MSPKSEAPSEAKTTGDEPPEKPKDTAGAKAPSRPSKEELAQRLVEVKVGAFVLLTLVAGVAIILALAQKRHVFEHRAVIHTKFQDVGGLREGAAVRLSGVGIGQVLRIAFAREDGKPILLVDLQVARESLAQMGSDTVAHIGSQGLLGDKIIELSVSEAGGPPLGAGATIASEPPADFNKLIDQASQVLEKANHVAAGVDVLVSGVTDPKSLANIRGIIGSLQKLGAAADHGPGLVHAVFYDPKTAKSFNSLLANVDRVGQHVDQGVRQIDRVLDATDKDGEQLVNNLSRAARFVGDDAAAIHDAKIIPHLDQASGDLAELIAYVKSGRGTIGLALRDPTVYEQLLTVLGGVARSRVLRALVRYAIVKDDGAKVGKAVDEPDAPPPIAPTPPPRPPTVAPHHGKRGR